MNNALTITNRVESDIKNYGELIIYDKDSYIFTNNETLEYAYFILKGRLKVSEVNLNNGKEQVLNILSKGDLYDIVTILDKKPHEYIVTTLEEVNFIRIPMKIIDDWIINNIDFRKFFFSYIGDQFRKIEDLTLSLSLDKSSTRLVKLILDSANQNSNKYKLIKGLNHEQIGAIIGSVRNVVNRDLQKLKNEGLIDIKRKDISIKDETLLLEYIH